MKGPLELAYEKLLAARERAYVAWLASGQFGRTGDYRAALQALLKARDEFDEQKRLTKLGE